MSASVQQIKMKMKMKINLKILSSSVDSRRPNDN